MLWVKAIHIISIVSWFAGLLYLPRLFVYHSATEDELGKNRFKVMESRLYFMIMNPAALFSLATGAWMLFSYAWQTYSQMNWLKLKIALVFLLVLYHLLLG